MTMPSGKTTSIALISVALVISLALWLQGWFLGSLLVMLVSGGIATAQPCVQRGRVVLRGTPIVAMFAIMLASASGMTMAIDEVKSRMAPETELACDQVAKTKDTATARGASVAGRFIF